jgi:hypothetical protein
MSTNSSLTTHLFTHACVELPVRAEGAPGARVAERAARAGT